jgi:hypothetical protein
MHIQTEVAEIEGVEDPGGTLMIITEIMGIDMELKGKMKVIFKEFKVAEKKVMEIGVIEADTEMEATIDRIIEVLMKAEDLIKAGAMQVEVDVMEEVGEEGEEVAVTEVDFSIRTIVEAGVKCPFIFVNAHV